MHASTTAAWDAATLPLLVRALRTPAEVLAFSLHEWDMCLRQALSANLTAALWSVLDDAGLLEQVATQPREHLLWAGRLAERHGKAVRWEVLQIADALRERELPLILLKGAAYVLAELPSARGRLFSDIDILVPKAALAAVESDLLMNGWVGGKQDAYDQHYYREWMHELPPMENVRRQTMIDVHHAILPPTARVHPDATLLRAAAISLPEALAGVTVQVLAPIDMVLHSATHLFFDGEVDHSLRDMVDMDRLLRHFGSDPAFWEALPGRARQLELSRPMFYALRYARRLFDTPVPACVLAALDASGRPPVLLLKWMDALFARTLAPPHASCAGRFSGVARFCLYLRGNWLRMPPLMLARHLFHKAFLSPRKGTSEN